MYCPISHTLPKGWGSCPVRCGHMAQQSKLGGWWRSARHHCSLLRFIFARLKVFAHCSSARGTLRFIGSETICLYACLSGLKLNRWLNREFRSFQITVSVQPVGCLYKWRANCRCISEIFTASSTWFIVTIIDASCNMAVRACPLESWLCSLARVYRGCTRDWVGVGLAPHSNLSLDRICSYLHHNQNQGSIYRIPVDLIKISQGRSSIK